MNPLASRRRRVPSELLWAEIGASSFPRDASDTVQFYSRREGDGCLSSPLVRQALTALVCVATSRRSAANGIHVKVGGTPPVCRRAVRTAPDGTLTAASGSRARRLRNEARLVAAETWKTFAEARLAPSGLYRRRVRQPFQARCPSAAQGNLMSGARMAKSSFQQQVGGQDCVRGRRHRTTYTPTRKR